MQVGLKSPKPSIGTLAGMIHPFILIIFFAVLIPCSKWAVAEELENICRYCDSAKYLAAAASEQKGPRYAPDRQVDVQHIKIDVTPDFKKRTVGGTTTIKFVPISMPLRELRLDAVNLEIRDVRGSSKVASFTPTAEDLTIVFKKPILPGDEAWVEIDHSAEPTQGFYFRTPEMGYLESDTHVWTQGETHEARHWFPCFDYPNERSSTEVICRVPPDMTVLSNGELMSESMDATTNLKAVRWLQKKPHVNYLICLVAGYFNKLEAKHRDVPLAFYTQPSLSEHADNSFADTAAIMEFFEDEIGVRYPWNKYYQVTIRDFTNGGMENTTLTTLTHHTIFADETENLHSTRSLDAHEMAHQWFGDYVTCKDWSHLWLNEGFATYYSALYEGRKMGPDALKYTMYRNANGRVLSAGKNDTRPIVYKGYATAGEQFDYRAYPKGAWVLHMLRHRLGKELYRKCIKTYLERNALSSVVTEELNEVIEELSGKSFDPFFDQWVYHARHPDLKVEYRWQAGDQLAKVTVQQTQKITDDVLLFRFPTKLRFHLKSGETVDHPIEIEKARHDFYVPLSSAPEVVRFDPEYSVLADITFGKSDDMLIAQTRLTDDVIGRLRAVAGLEKRKNKRSVAALETVLNQDAFYGVRMAAAKALGKQATDEAFQALSQSLDQPNAKVRREVVQSIGRFYRDAARDLLLQVASNDKNPGIASDALRSLGKYQHEKVTELITQSLNATSFRNEMASAAISAIRSQSNDDYSEALHTMLKVRKNELSRRTVGRGLNELARMNRKSDDKTKIREFLTGFAKDPNSTVRTSAIDALGQLGDERARAALDALASDGRDDRVAKAAKSARDKLRSEVKFVPSEVAEMRKLLRELQSNHDSLKNELEEMKRVAKARESSQPQEVAAKAKNRKRRRENKMAAAQSDKTQSKKKQGSKKDSIAPAPAEADDTKTTGAAN